MPEEDIVDVPEMHARALRVVGRAFGAIAKDTMTEPTPCSEWDVRTLANHMVLETRVMLMLLDGVAPADIMAALAGDLLGVDPAAAYEDAARAAAEAVYAPGVMRITVTQRSGTRTGEDFCIRRILNTVVHGWDLAQALTIEYRVPSDIVAMLAVFVESHRDELAESPAYSPAVAVAVDADNWTHILATLGRKG